MPSFDNLSGGQGEARRCRQGGNCRTSDYLGGYVYRPALDVAIPVFDPGIPNDPRKWEAQDLAELRRAEAVGIKLAEALDKTGIFNSVLVVPDTAVSADLYVMGTLKESNGEDLEIELKLFATTGKELMKKKK